jgi:translation initiation factor IF-3
MNARIASSQVRVIAENGSDLGVYSIKEARRLAQRQVQDLVQIGPNDDPPICRLTGRSRFLIYRLRTKADGTQII